MGLSIVSPTNMSTIMAEITLAQTEGSADTEGLTLPQEFIDPEILKDFSSMGCLRGEAKPFTFMFQECSSLPQQITEYLSDINRPHEHKSLDHKNSDHHLSFKENLIKEKEFKAIEPAKKNLTGKQDEIKDTVSKTRASVQKTLLNAVLPKTSSQLKETPALKQQQNQAKSLQHKVHAELSQREEQLRNNTEPNRKAAEPRKHARESDRELEMMQPHMQKLDKNEDRQQEQHKRKQEEEEGFAEGQHEHHQENPEEKEKKDCRVEKISETFSRDFASYAVEESILSEIFKMRVSQFDVLILFIEILKLDIRSREQEKLARKQERELQLLHMQNVVDNYKSQGKWLMFSSLGSGILGIVSGFCPIIGHMKGPWILQKLQSVFSSLDGMDSGKFFKSLTKITSVMSDMQKSTGQIYQTFSEGNRTFDQHMSDLYRADWDETTRSIDEIRDNWKGIENFLYQALQMYHDSIRQLYSH